MHGRPNQVDLLLDLEDLQLDLVEFQGEMTSQILLCYFGQRCVLRKGVVDLNHLEDVEMHELLEKPEHVVSLDQEREVLGFGDIVDGQEPQQICAHHILLQVDFHFGVNHQCLTNFELFLEPVGLAVVIVEEIHRHFVVGFQFLHH